MRQDAMILAFWMLNFKPTFLLYLLFHFHQELCSSSFSAIRVVSSWYLRLLIFLPTILIPSCASCSLAFHMMFTSCKLNKQGDNIQPWHTPFPIWNQSVVSCLVLFNQMFAFKCSILHLPSSFCFEKKLSRIEVLEYISIKINKKYLLSLHIIFKTWSQVKNIFFSNKEWKFLLIILFG